MTLSESSKLTPEQLRVAVAERLGWRYPGSSCLKLESWGRWIPPKGCKAKRVPNFPACRNACSKFEEMLIAPFSGPENDTMEGAERIKSRYDQYEDNLKEVCFGLGSPWHATPTQRCRAFLAVTEK